MTPAFLEEKGHLVVHVKLGPAETGGRWMYASDLPNARRPRDQATKLAAEVQPERFASGRWTLRDAYERTEGGAHRSVVFEEADAIVLHACPFCGSGAVFDEPSPDRISGLPVRTASCTGPDCGASVSIPLPSTAQEERLAAKWNRRPKLRPYHR